MFKELIRTIKSKDLIFYLIEQQLKSSHRDKLLGNIWSLLNPLLMMVIFYLIFHGLRHSGTEFMLYFLSGIIAWEAFATPVRGTALCLKQRKDMIYKFPVPLGVFPIAIVLQRVYDFFWGFLAYFLIFICIKILAVPSLSIPTWQLLLLPIWMFFYLMFTLGICFIVARIGVFFADMNDILSILLLAGYFLNPVFIDLSNNYIAPKHHALYLLINPLAGYMIYLRYLMPGSNVTTIHVPIPIPYYPLYLIGVSIILLLVGFSIFYRGCRHYSKYL